MDNSNNIIIIINEIIMTPENERTDEQRLLLAAYQLGYKNAQVDDYID